MRAHPVGQAVADRADLHVDGLHVRHAVAFQVDERRVGLHHLGSGHLVCSQRGADHVDPVESGFGRDRLLLAGEAEAPFAGLQGEVRSHLVAVDDASGAQADLARITSRQRLLVPLEGLHLGGGRSHDNTPQRAGPATGARKVRRRRATPPERTSTPCASSANSPSRPGKMPERSPGWHTSSASGRSRTGVGPPGRHRRGSMPG